MTMRSKQWYTKASTLPNSVAKVSIGRLPSISVSATRSSDRRPVEIKGAGGTGRGKKGFKGTKPAVSFPCSGNTEDRPPGRESADARRLQNFKYVWVGLGLLNTALVISTVLPLLVP